jgi:hypothetical protein
MSDDDLSALTPEQITAFHRAAATLKDEDFSPEEMAGIRKGWLGLVKERAYAGPGVHYEQPLIHGDLKVGGAIVAAMFSVEPGDDLTNIGPDVIRDLGHGSERAGRKVLERFVARVRHGARDGVTLVHNGRHDDDDHGWRVG